MSLLQRMRDSHDLYQPDLERLRRWYYLMESEASEASFSGDARAAYRLQAQSRLAARAWSISVHTRRLSPSPFSPGDMEELD